MAKIAVLPLTADLFLEWSKACRDGPPRRFVVKENPLPDDAKIVGVELFGNKQDLILALVVESESFEDVPADVAPPEVPRIPFEVVV